MALIDYVMLHWFGVHQFSRLKEIKCKDGAKIIELEWDSNDRPKNWREDSHVLNNFCITLRFDANTQVGRLRTERGRDAAVELVHFERTPHPADAGHGLQHDDVRNEDDDEVYREHLSTRRTLSSYHRECYTTVQSAAQTALYAPRYRRSCWVVPSTGPSGPRCGAVVFREVPLRRDRAQRLF